jgi:hypothetical protein
MGMNRTINYWGAWLGCFVILLASMAPSISRVLVSLHTPPAVAMEICTTDGMMQVVSPHDNHASSAPTEQVLHIEHCPFCLNNPVALGVQPVAPTQTLPVIVNYQRIPALFYQASRPLFAWSFAQPRAPPAFS